MDQSGAYNSIIAENSKPDSAASYAVVNCCIASVPSISTNNIITTDARFADSAKSDFRLLANSPCLDKASTNFVGTAGATAARTDYLGNARLQGAGLDMGAIEGAVPNLAAVFGEKQGAGSGSLTPTNRCLLTTFPTQIVFTATAAAGSALRHFTVNGAKMPDCGNTFTLTVTQPGGYAVAAVFYPARYVDAVSGSDANDGTTPASAWRTLQFGRDQRGRRFDGPRRARRLHRRRRLWSLQQQSRRPHAQHCAERQRGGKSDGDHGFKGPGHR